MNGREVCHLGIIVDDYASSDEPALDFSDATNRIQLRFENGRFRGAVLQLGHAKA